MGAAIGASLLQNVISTGFSNVESTTAINAGSTHDDGTATTLVAVGFSLLFLLVLIYFITKK